MKQTKIRMESFSLYDHTGLARHLERMAAKGWLLEKISFWGWKYKRIEPKTIHFDVTYFPNADFYDPAPSEEELTFREFCEEAGWKLAAASGQIQIFYNENPDPVPLDTDARVQVENIHAAGKKSFLLSNWLYLGLALLELGILFGDLRSDPVSLFTQNAALLSGACWLLLILMTVLDLCNYYGWRKKALCLAERTGQILPTKSRPWIPMTCLILILVAFGAWLLSIRDAQTVLTFLCSVGGYFLLFSAVNLCRELLKKKGVSKAKNLTITLIVDVVLAVILIGGVGWFLANADVGTPKPVDTYEKYGVTYEVFDDELPLYVEDLRPAEHADYSCQVIRHEKGLLGWSFLGSQQGRKDREDPTGLWYHVVEIQSDWAFKKCWKQAIKDLGGIWDRWAMQNPWDRGCVPVDTESWNADEAYRVYKGKEPQSWYLIRWGNRYARIHVEWEVIDEEKTIIAEKLTKFEP